jgi:hypothetical protein
LLSPGWFLAKVAGFGVPATFLTVSPQSVYATANLALPLADWIAIGAGNSGFDPVIFENRAAANSAQRFYMLAVP